MRPKIVILDGELAHGGDLSWKRFEEIGDLEIYNQTSPEQFLDRVKEAKVIVTNKFKLNAEHFAACPDLKLVCLLATGYDNVDVVAAKQAGVTVCNAQAYSTDSVAQHVFALLLAGANQVSEHNISVQDGHWYTEQWSYTLTPLKALKGLTMGICGLGKIGKKVAEVAQAFGMKVIAHTRTPDHSLDDITFVNINQLCQQSDVISVHLPHSESTHQIFDKEKFSVMKDDAIFINTGRGGLVKEEDLAAHLSSHPNFTAALDVLSAEPPQEGHPLIGLENCIITPHHAWANPEARTNLLRIVAENITTYLDGSPQNVVS